MSDPAPVARQPLSSVLLTSDRVLVAPILTCSLSDAPHTLSLSERHKNYDEISYTITFTYEQPGSESDAERPITFYRPALFALSTWTILHHASNGLETMEKNGDRFPLAPNGPRVLPLTIYKGDFVSLYPGESWSDRIPIDEDELAEPFQVGQRYTFQFIGAIVQWWDWGILKDHKTTSIREDETSHDKRPKIIISSSNSFDFVVTV